MFYQAAGLHCGQHFKLNLRVAECDEFHTHRLLGSIAGIGALQPLLRKVSGPFGKETLSIPVPEGVILDADGNSIRKVRVSHGNRGLGLRLPTFASLSIMQLSNS